MTWFRRDVLIGGAATLLAVGAAEAQPPAAPMHGLIGKVRAVPGQRDALLAILLDGTGSMPGCLSYVIAKDPVDADAIWITEVWDSRASHAASLQLPAVQEAIRRGRPLIAGFEHGQETIPVGGVGLPRHAGGQR